MKKSIKLLTGISFFLLFHHSLCSQVFNPVKWEFSAQIINDREAEIHLKAIVEEPWHIYAQEPNGGYNPTSFKFEASNDYELIGKVIEPANFKREVDKIMEIEYNLYQDVVVFKQKIRIKSTKPFQVKGNVNFFSCDDKKCLPPVDEEFVLDIIPKEKVISSSEQHPVTEVVVSKTEDNTQIQDNEIPVQEKKTTEIPEAEKNEKGKRTLIHLLILSFLGGLGALLTPCVYPIIPLTVSFFMRNAGQNRNKAISTGILFSISIIFIYTSLGLIMGLFKIDLTGAVASHWLANSIFFIIFLIFAFSFFGMFELVLPGSWSNKVDSKADKGGLTGIFFMALATVLISFSCTGPIVGVLIGKSLQGELLQPVLGMFAFSLAFSLPFPLLAIFPNLIKNMPKSGGWMNSVKVFFAFIMLAFSLKFLYNIDKVLHGGFISRELFIAVWIVLAILLGLYFLGKIKFYHDSDIPHITVPRLLLSILSFSFAIILSLGLYQSDLKGLSAILPDKKVSSQLITDVSVNQKQFLCGQPKYSDFLYLPHGLLGYFDITEGIACARQQNKPVFLDFKGHVCTNCKEMEQKVWSDPRVLQRLRDHYIVIGIFTDDRTVLPEEEWYTSPLDGKIKKTLGKKNLDFQITKYGTNSIPYYVLVDPEGNELAEPRGYNLDTEAFIKFLDQGIEKFQLSRRN